MLRSFLLLLAASVAVYGQYACTGTNSQPFPTITETNQADVEQTTLFPPYLHREGSGFQSGGRFRIAVVVSDFYTGTVKVEDNTASPAVAVDMTAGSTTLTFHPRGGSTASAVATASGVTADSFTGTNAVNLALVTTMPGVTGTPHENCYTYKSVDIDWTLLTATVTYPDTSTGLDGVDRSATAYPDRITFRGAVRVYSTRNLVGATFQNGYTRIADDKLFYQVSFPTQVTVTFGDLLVYAEVTVQVVVTSHIVNLINLSVANSNPTVSATITFATTVQMPFLLQDTVDISASIDDSFVGIDTTITNNVGGVLAISGTTCEDDATTTCTQNWSITTDQIDVTAMNTAQGHCRIDAVFTVDFDVVCQASTITAGNCPLQNDLDEQFTLALKSASLCPTVVVDIQWQTQTLFAYQDNAFTTTRTAFRVDDTAYFKATVASDTNAAVMTGCEIQSISSTVGANPSTALYAIGPPVVTCDTIGSGCWVPGSFIDGGITANQCIANFAIKLITAVFDVPRFQSLTHSIAAVIKVDFAGFSKLKRVDMMQEGDTADAATIADIEIQSLEIDTGDVEPINGGETTAGESQTIILEDQGSDMFIYIIIGVCAFVALLIGALVIYLRRSKKEKKSQNAITPQIQVQMQPQHGYITQHTVGMAATA